jgi:deazaflavin-dependent oxidoreductase (nitroreductase family)
MSRTLRWLFRAPIYVYRWKCGWLLGCRFLLLCHIGRQTGLCRQTVLEIMEYRQEGPEAIVMSAFGQGADWFRNIKVTPDPKVTIGRQQFVATYRWLDVEEAASAVMRYEQRNWLVRPIIRLVLSRFLGWQYRGTDRDRRRLVAQLPVIAFRPKGASVHIAERVLRKRRPYPCVSRRRHFSRMVRARRS